MAKRWQFKEKYPKEFADQMPGYEPVILQLLFDRGLDTQEKIDEFLNPDYTQDVHDPFLFQDMEKAVGRIMAAIANQEKILIHGDYDADGVTAIVLLEKTLRKLGAQNVAVFIPHREIDGHGLNMTNVEKFVAQGINLVITVDCGITNFEPIKFLKEKKVDAVITDHHLSVEKLPEAYAILNCPLARENYPFKKLAGVGMTFKLAQALFRSPLARGQDFEAFEKWLLDLVAIGTIGDVSPIVGENRTLCKYGLMVLNKTPRLGLRELIRVASLSDGKELENPPLGAVLYDLNVYNIAYQIVPRLNAAGRVDHANLAYKLLTTEDELEAIALARDIQERNLARQNIADQTLLEAKEIFGKISDDKKILIAVKEGWSPGIVGLVAGKLKDEFCRPVILFSKDGDRYTGSGRSIPEFNITEALQECHDFLERFGGHSQACGCGLTGAKNFKKFKEKMEMLAREKLEMVPLVPTLEIGAEMELKDLDWLLFDELEKFEPFAEANPRPLFLVKNLKVNEMAVVGKNGGHLRFCLSQNGFSRKAISFGTAEEWGSAIKVGEMIDVVLEFGVNEWNGSRELQLKVVDWKRHANNDANKFKYHANENDSTLLHKDLSFKINGILYEIQNRIGKTSNERQYCELGELLFKEAGLKFEREKEIQFEFKEGTIRGNRVDFLMDKIIPLDFKAKKYITRDDYFQMQRYLQSTKLKLGLIVNFKKYPLEIKRVINKQGVR